MLALILVVFGVRSSLLKIIETWSTYGAPFDCHCNLVGKPVGFISTQWVSFMGGVGVFSPWWLHGSEVRGVGRHVAVQPNTQAWPHSVPEFDPFHVPWCFWGRDDKICVDLPVSPSLGQSKVLLVGQLRSYISNQGFQAQDSFPSFEF